MGPKLLMGMGRIAGMCVLNEVLDATWLPSSGPDCVGLPVV